MNLTIPQDTQIEVRDRVAQKEQPITIAEFEKNLHALSPGVTEYRLLRSQGIWKLRVFGQPFGSFEATSLELLGRHIKELAANL